jgi:hypothetical protein
MNTVTKNNIDKLLEDISSIKTVINRNKPLLQQVLNPAQFRWLGLLAGISIIFFCLLIYFLVRHFGSFSDTPATVRFILYGTMAITMIWVQILKRRAFLTAAKKVDQKLTISSVLKEMFTFRIIHIYAPVVALVIVLCIYFTQRNMAYFIVPTISIGTGLLYNFIGSVTEIRQYLIFGYWMLLTGVLAIIFSFIPALIVFAVSLGGGMLLFFLLGSHSWGLHRKE